MEIFVSHQMILMVIYTLAFCIRQVKVGVCWRTSSFYDRHSHGRGELGR